MSSPALAQRRQHDRQHVQAIEQVFAEAPLTHFLLQVPVRGGDHAHVHVEVHRPADALERLLLEKPQQLRLERRHHLADLVEKHRPAIGRFEQAALLPIRARERAALVAEQLAFEQGLGQRRAGDVHERTDGARAGVVEDLRREILPGAALARQQHRRGGARRNLLQQRPQSR